MPKKLSEELENDAELREHFGGGPVAEESPVEEGEPVSEPDEEEGESAADAPDEDEAGDGDKSEEPEEPSDEEAVKPAPKMVPHAALHAAREEKKTLQANYARLQARVNAMLAAQSQRRRNDDADAPDLDTDPLGHIEYLQRKREEAESALESSAVATQIDMGVQNDEAAYRQIQPDYDNAAEHYVQSRAKELMMFHPPQQVQAMLVQETRAIAREAWKNGMPMAEAVYRLAQARGYVAPVEDAASAQGEPAAPKAQRNPLEAVRKGQRSGLSVGAASGSSSGSSAAELNAQALLNMTDEEFERHLRLGERGANERFANIGR